MSSTAGSQGIPARGARWCRSRRWRHTITAGVMAVTMTAMTIVAGAASATTIDRSSVPRSAHAVAIAPNFRIAPTGVVAPADRAAGTSTAVAPVAAYSLNGTTADSSGNGNTISWVGTPSYGAGLTTGSQAAEVSDATNYLVMPSNADTEPKTTADFSVAFWVHEDSTSSDSPIVSNQNFVACNNAGFSIYNESGTTLPRFCVGDTNGGTREYDMFSSSVSLTSGWHYIALTYTGTASSGGTFTGYFDGDKAFTQTVAAGANITGYGGLVAGYDGSQADTGDGYIDAGFADLDYYDQTISAAQVAADYAATEPAPQAPSGVTVTATSGSTVTVAWSADAGAARYAVYAATAAGGEDTSGTPACTATSASGCTVSGLTRGKKYYFEVVAANHSGASPVSSEVSVTPISAPAGLRAVSSDGSVRLTWAKYPGAVTYAVYRAYSSGGESTSSAAACTTTAASSDPTSCTVRGLTDSVPYYFVLVARTASDTTPLSLQVTATPLGTPRGVRASAVRHGIRISWGTAYGATEYAVYASLRSGGEKRSGTAACVVTAPPAGTDHCVVSRLRPGTRYFFTVVAKNSSGASTPSQQASVRTRA